MKNLYFTYLLFFISNIHASTKMEMIRDVVASYQAESVSRYGVPITLEFNEADSFNALGGLIATGDPTIIFFNGIN